MRRTIFSEKAPKPIGPYSQAVLTKDTLYCSGQIAIDAETGQLTGEDVSEQTERVCHNLSAVLASADMTFDNVVKTTCYLTDMDNFAAFNGVYERFFTLNPARSCVAVKQLPKGALVEIDITAVL